MSRKGGGSSKVRKLQYSLQSSMMFHEVAFARAWPLAATVHFELQFAASKSSGRDGSSPGEESRNTRIAGIRSCDKLIRSEAKRPILIFTMLLEVT